MTRRARRLLLRIMRGIGVVRATAIYGPGSILARTARRSRRGDFGLSAAESASATTEVRDGANTRAPLVGDWAREEGKRRGQCWAVRGGSEQVGGTGAGADAVLLG